MGWMQFLLGYLFGKSLDGSSQPSYQAIELSNANAIVKTIKSKIYQFNSVKDDIARQLSLCDEILALIAQARANDLLSGHLSSIESSIKQMEAFRRAGPVGILVNQGANELMMNRPEKALELYVQAMVEANKRGVTDADFALVHGESMDGNKRKLTRQFIEDQARRLGWKTPPTERTPSSRKSLLIRRSPPKRIRTTLSRNSRPPSKRRQLKC